MSKEELVFRCKTRKAPFGLGCKEVTGAPKSASGTEVFAATWEGWARDST